MGVLFPHNRKYNVSQLRQELKTLRVEKRTDLTRPQLRQAAINLLSTGMSEKDTALVLCISTTLLKKLLKGVKAPTTKQPLHRP